jgi:hypothetical protein
MTYVYDFSEGGKDQKDLLGGKGANLAEMISVSTSMRGMNSRPCLLTPPPTTIRSGENSFSTVR